MYFFLRAHSTPLAIILVSKTLGTYTSLHQSIWPTGSVHTRLHCNLYYHVYNSIASACGRHEANKIFDKLHAIFRLPEHLNRYWHVSVSRLWRMCMIVMDKSPSNGRLFFTSTVFLFWACLLCRRILLYSYSHIREWAGNMNRWSLITLSSLSRLG